MSFIFRFFVRRGFWFFSWRRFYIEELSNQDCPLLPAPRNKVCMSLLIYTVACCIWVQTTWMNKLKHKLCLFFFFTYGSRMSDWFTRQPLCFTLFRPIVSSRLVSSLLPPTAAPVGGVAPRMLHCRSRRDSTHQPVSSFGASNAAVERRQLRLTRYHSHHDGDEWNHPPPSPTHPLSPIPSPRLAAAAFSSSSLSLSLSRLHLLRRCFLVRLGKSGIGFPARLRLLAVNLKTLVSGSR